MKTVETMKTQSNFIRIIGIFSLLLLLGFQYGYGQANAGPDTTICQGNGVQIGTPGNGQDCYKWSPEDGLSDPTSPTPTASPERTTNYTLTVTTADFTSTTTDDVEVEVVGIDGNVTFDPTQLPADGTSTSQADATAIPTGSGIDWTIEGPALGCTIDQNGLVTAGTTIGKITVRATNSAHPDCYKEADLCIQMDCCPDIEGTRQFGGITVALPGGLLQGSDAGSGWCSYSTNATINISFLGIFRRSESVPGVSVSWEEKKTQSGYDYRNVTLNWTGSESTRDFGYVQANLTALSLSVSPNGNISGSVTFDAFNNQEVNMGGIAFLQPGLSGTFTYTYNSGPNDFQGNFDFGGITGFVVHLKKGGTKIAQISAESFDANGNINNARLTAATPGTYQTNGFTVTLETLDLGFNYSIADNDVTFLGGTGQIKLSNIQNIDGEFTLTLAFTASNVTATVAATGIQAFGCTVSGTLSGTFDYNFDLQSISGSNVSAQHNDFDQAFSNVGFLIENGELEEFSIGSLTAKYKNKVEFSMSNAFYNKGQGKLQFDASVVLPALQLNVSEFTINSGGVVTVGNIQGIVDRNPVYVEVNIGWSTDEFRGSVTARFAGGVAFQCGIVIGSTGTFNYGHFTMQLNAGAGGVPLGPSGLKIKSLRGEFGFNWSAPLLQGGTGSPQQGTTTIGFGLGISDVANLVLVEAYVQFVLGATTTMTLQGTVKVPASAPHYVTGTLTVQYVFGSGAIQGQVNSAVKFPPSSGSVVSLNSGNITFGIDNNQWSVSGTNMTGKIFDEINATASVNMSAPMSAPVTGINGTLSGTLSWAYTHNFEYPNGFNSSTCATADATDNWLGFGCEGSLNLGLNGGLSVTLNQNGVVGSISAGASGASNIRVKWPCIISCGNNCVDNYNISISGNINAEAYQGGIHVWGTIMVSDGSDTEEAELDFTL